VGARAPPPSALRKNGSNRGEIAQPAAHWPDMRCISTALAAAASLALVLGPIAEAKSPPNGLYSCTYPRDGTFYADALHIKSKTTYKVEGRKKGEYTTKRHRINFMTGGYKHLYGKWRKHEGDNYSITLYRKKNDTKWAGCTKTFRP
jgi:hypothetical protein